MFPHGPAGHHPSSSPSRSPNRQPLARLCAGCYFLLRQADFAGALPRRAAFILSRPWPHAHGRRPTEPRTDGRRHCPPPRPAHLPCRTLRRAFGACLLCACVAGRGGGGGGLRLSRVGSCGVPAPAWSVARRPASPCYITILISRGESGQRHCCPRDSPPEPGESGVTPERYSYRGQSVFQSIQTGHWRQRPGDAGAEERAEHGARVDVAIPQNIHTPPHTMKR